MKFCKNLQRVVEISDPEWAPYWTNYKMLKKLIKELPSLVPADEAARRAQNDGMHVARARLAADSSREHRAGSPVSTESSFSSVLHHQASKHVALQQRGDFTVEADSDDFVRKQEGRTDGAVSIEQTGSDRAEQLGKCPGEIAFFKLLHAEFKKATHFFEKAQLEFEIREERVREGMVIMTRPNSIMVSEKWSMLAKSIYRLYKDLLLLETFAIMTYCSFSKILKKHDKVTGYETRTAFMANVVNKANFTNYPKVLAMITRCEQLYDDVSSRLMHEGKEGLYEDERLFINMISRLNEQALNNADAPERQEGRRPPTQAGTFSAASSTSSGQPKQQPVSHAVAALRLLVEENDAMVANQVSDVHDGEEDSVDRKRKASAATQRIAGSETSAPSIPKRPRTS